MKDGIDVDRMIIGPEALFWDGNGEDLDTEGVFVFLALLYGVRHTSSLLRHGHAVQGASIASVRFFL